MARRVICAVATFALVGIAVAPSAAAQPAACAGWQIEYALAANLRLGDTPQGLGDGVHAVGPGRAVIRFEDREGRPGGAVALLSYEMHEHVTVSTRALFWTTTVVSDTVSQATPDPGNPAASGLLRGTTVEWNTPVSGYRSDGAVTCEGQFCGKFGAPPAGRSELHLGAHAVHFASFQFARDMKTFTMPDALVASAESPRQKTYASVAGREMSRECLASR